MTIVNQPMQLGQIRRKYGLPNYQGEKPSGSKGKKQQAPSYSGGKRGQAPDFKREGGRNPELKYSPATNDNRFNALSNLRGKK